MSWTARRRDFPGRELPRRPRSYRVLVLGGARSGKSVTAERLLAGRDQVDYVATGALPATATRSGRPGCACTSSGGRRTGPRWKPGTWKPSWLPRPHPPELATPVLVDCLSTWLAGVMDECGLWSGTPGAGQALAARVDGLLDAWQATRRTVIAVSNEVGSGVVPGTASGVRYRDELGMLNTRVAAHCQQVWLCTAGIPRRLR